MSSEGRSIDKIVPAITGNGKIVRLVGTLDCDGAGTSHPLLPEVDPFILCDFGNIAQNGMPPFGAHPHRGHSVVTVLLQGRIQSWDSFRTRDESHTVAAPASYWVDAGAGLFHDEKAVIDDESNSLQHAQLLQLWVGVTEADRAKPAKVQYDQDLPSFECLDASTDKMVGKGIYHVGGTAKIETPHPVTVIHITQQPGSTYKVPIDPKHGGFAVVLKGKAKFGGNDKATSADEYDVIVLAPSNNTADHLQVTTPDDVSCDYVVCTGKQLHQSWAKKLSANGAIIAATPEEARALAPQVEAMSKAGKAGGSFAPFGME
eukprot:CAMPEP_0119006522 /NCGR_PEP_ID=MMETSP1176-20130426/2337_1 /TAXON_ID=265551 /ORGANISM="Synedropsis recta cf, Strain CCMP1620" /LENGTH=316 /DNA_ID=CAMNT_0006958439 /DNA_START=86 /DNA_END=1036 /DNA_ORIENTATION=-